MQFWAIRMRGPRGRMPVSRITRTGEVEFKWNNLVFKTMRGAYTAIDIVRLNGYINLANALEVFECDEEGREIPTGVNGDA